MTQERPQSTPATFRVGEVVIKGTLTPDGTGYVFKPDPDDPNKHLIQEVKRKAKEQKRTHVSYQSPDTPTS